MSTTFQYLPAKPISYRGCLLHSTLELKYVLSIEDDYEFLREYVTIYYDPKTNQPTNYIREGILKYTPDFVIRHRTSGEAFLVEVKPGGFDDSAYLKNHRLIAENYIRQRGYDWQFKVVYQDDIVLSMQQWQYFYQIIKGRKVLNHKLDMLKLENRFNNHEPKYFYRIPVTPNPKEKVHFVCRGTPTEVTSASPAR